MAQKIDEKYCFIQHCGVDIIIMKSNGYVNATELCKSKNKNFEDWKKINQDLINELENINKTWKNVKNAPSFDKNGVLIEVKTDGIYKHEVKGCYIHQDLVSYVCFWILPSFAIQVCNIINFYNNNNFKEKLEKRNRKIERQTYQLGILKNIRDKLTDQKKELLYKIKVLEEENTILKM